MSAQMAEGFEVFMALVALLQPEVEMFAAPADGEELGFLPAKEASMAAAVRTLCRVCRRPPRTRLPAPSIDRNA